MTPAARRSLSIVAVVVALATAAGGFLWQSAGTRVCPGDKAAFARYAGEYASTRLLATLAKERSVPRGIEIESGTKPKQPYVVLVTTEELYTSRSWHEPDAVIETCLTISGDILRIDGSQQVYTRVADDHAAYFTALFSGCFTDETNARWCFTPNTIAVGDREHKARLMMDLVEQPNENVVRVEDTEQGLWVFRPLPNGGWRVFQVAWSIDEDPPVIDDAAPWRILTPIAGS